MKFSIVMSVFDTLCFLPRAVACVMQQEHADWELLLMLDGPAVAGKYHPHQVLRRVSKALRGQRIFVQELPRAEGCWGNAARHAALAEATGDYVCWVNHDNLIAPQYLAVHSENIARQPGCVSVVDIDLWNDDRYFGRYPRKLAMSHIDLLCFAIPLEIARRIGWFSRRQCDCVRWSNRGVWWGRTFEEAERATASV